MAPKAKNGKNGTNGSADVVVVDDSTSDVYLYNWLFEQSPYKLHFFSEFSTAIEYIESADPVCIIVDDTVPDTKKDATSIIRRLSEDHAVIVISNNTDPKAIKNAMAAGAHKYLNKQTLSREAVEWSIQTAVRGKNMHDGMSQLRRSVSDVKSSMTIGFVKTDENFAKMSEQIIAIEKKIENQYQVVNDMNNAILVELRTALDNQKCSLHDEREAQEKAEAKESDDESSDHN